MTEGKSDIHRIFPQNLSGAWKKALLSSLSTPCWGGWNINLIRFFFFFAGGGRYFLFFIFVLFSLAFSYPGFPPQQHRKTSQKNNLFRGASWLNRRTKDHLIFSFTKEAYMLEAVCRRIQKWEFQRLYLTSINPHCIAALKGDFFSQVKLR